MAEPTRRNSPNVQVSGLARASSCFASSAETPGGQRAEEHVSEVMVAGRDDDERHQDQGSRPQHLGPPALDELVIGRPIMTAKQTCIDGTAA